MDAFRHLYPDQEGAYTWWSQRFDKRSKNDGWRLDYFLVDRNLAKRIHGVEHHTEIFGSDHCPIELKIHLNYVAGEKFDRSKLRAMRPSIDFPNEFLGELWEETDWTAAEQALANLQKEIALAAQQHDGEKIKAHVTPSQSAVARIKAGLQELILTHNRSQKNLIDSINRKLSGWASYHRYSNARAAFREIDELVESCLWKAALARHPRMNPPKLRAKYWYTDSKGKSVYSLPHNRSVRVRKISETLLVECYEKILLNKNPYIDIEYFQSRHE